MLIPSRLSEVKVGVFAGRVVDVVVAVDAPLVTIGCGVGGRRTHCHLVVAVAPSVVAIVPGGSWDVARDRPGVSL